MVSNFYRRHSLVLVLSCLAILPGLTFLGERVPSNNDIETWLPRHSTVRTEYDQFCSTFGADETILIAFEKPFPSPEQIESLSGRMSGLQGVASCWSRQQIVTAMLSNDVSEEVAHERLVNLMAAKDDSLETLLISINTYGIKHRAETVADIRYQLEY